LLLCACEAIENSHVFADGIYACESTSDEKWSALDKKWSALDEHQGALDNH